MTPPVSTFALAHYSTATGGACDTSKRPSLSTLSCSHLLEMQDMSCRLEKFHHVFPDDPSVVVV